MQSLIALVLATDAVARQFSYRDDETDVAPAARPVLRTGPRLARTRSSLAGALHRAGDAVAPAPYRTAH